MKVMEETSAAFAWISGIGFLFLIDMVKEYTNIPEILTGNMPVEWYLKRKNYLGVQKAIKKSEVLYFSCNNITEKDIDYVCMHAISEKKWRCFCDPSVSEAIKFLLQNKASVNVYAPGTYSGCGSVFCILYAGQLSKYIRCYADRHTKLNKKEFLDLVSKVKGEIES